MHLYKFLAGIISWCVDSKITLYNTKITFLNGNIQVVALLIALIHCLFQEFEGKLKVFERLTVSFSTQLQAHQLVSLMVFVTVNCEQLIKSFYFACVL